MMRSRFIGLVFATAIASGLAAQAPAPSVFPTVSAYSLSKARVTLPADLHSDTNLLLLYFRADQQSDVEAWNAVIDRWRDANPALGTYTSLVTQRVNILSRWWDNASLRSAFPNAKRWSLMLPLYVDRAEFLKALDIHSEKRVVLLVTDRQGHVLGRADGAPTEQSRAALTRMLHTTGVAPGVKSPQ